MNTPQWEEKVHQGIIDLTALHKKCRELYQLRHYMDGPNREHFVTEMKAARFALSDACEYFEQFAYMHGVEVDDDTPATFLEGGGSSDTPK